MPTKRAFADYTFTSLVAVGWVLAAIAAAQAQAPGVGGSPQVGYPALGGVMPTGFTVRQVAADALFEDSSPPSGAIAPAPAPLESGPPPATGTVSDGPTIITEGPYMEQMPYDVGMGYQYPTGMTAGCPQGWLGSCPRIGYVAVDGFLMKRADDQFSTLSNGFSLNEFEYENAWRVTLGQRWDCADGWEMTFVGPFEWQETRQLNGTGLYPFFSTAGVDITAFVDAEFHAQSYESKLNSFEFGRKYWAWDVMSQTVGVRYVNIEEEFRFASQQSTGETGLYTWSTNNHVMGLQYGLDILYPYGPRWVFASKGKLGGYVNVADGEARLENAGSVEFSNQSDAAELAFLGEFGVYASCRVLPRVTIQAGYEFWYLYGVALAFDQQNNLLSPSTGRSLESDNDIFYHGLTAGFQVVW